MMCEGRVKRARPSLLCWGWLGQRESGCASAARAWAIVASRRAQAGASSGANERTIDPSPSSSVQPAPAAATGSVALNCATEAAAGLGGVEDLEDATVE